MDITADATLDKSGQKSDVLYLFDSVSSPDILDHIGYDSDMTIRNVNTARKLAELVRR